MKKLKPLTVENAPESSKDTLRAIQKELGFIPNLIATFAHSPAVLKGYTALDAEWEKSSLSPIERQLVLLSASVVNQCAYCQAAHSTILKKFLKVDPKLVQAVREDERIPDAKQAVLVNLTKELISKRDFVSEATKKVFLDHGYVEEQILEVVLGIALKTMSNYIDHIVGVEVDEVFKAETPAITVI